MQAMDDMALLREYASRQSEAAFETLVHRYINLVYSVALQQVREAHLAEEITQAVFIILAQKAGQLGPNVILAGWFFNTVRYVAAAEFRAAVRRKKYEHEAHMESSIQETGVEAPWEQMLPLLHSPMPGLTSLCRAPSPAPQFRALLRSLLTRNLPPWR